jgi:hypothetical protein
MGTAPLSAITMRWSNHRDGYDHRPSRLPAGAGAQEEARCPADRLEDLDADPACACATARGGGTASAIWGNSPDARAAPCHRQEPASWKFDDLPDMTPEEHERRGDATEALFRELTRRVRGE